MHKNWGLLHVVVKTKTNFYHCVLSFTRRRASIKQTRFCKVCNFIWYQSSASYCIPLFVACVYHGNAWFISLLFNMGLSLLLQYVSLFCIFTNVCSCTRRVIADCESMLVADVQLSTFISCLSPCV